MNYTINIPTKLYSFSSIDFHQFEFIINFDIDYIQHLLQIPYPVPSFKVNVNTHVPFINNSSSLNTVITPLKEFINFSMLTTQYSILGHSEKDWNPINIEIIKFDDKFGTNEPYRTIVLYSSKLRNRIIVQLHEFILNYVTVFKKKNVDIDQYNFKLSGGDLDSLILSIYTKPSIAFHWQETWI